MLEQVGLVAEWLRRGLQILAPRFDSGRGLQTSRHAKTERRGEAAGMGIDFEAQRVKMVDGQLRTTDVTGHALLQAFLDVPREMFVPEAKRALAYLDADIEIAPGRILVEASPIAKLIALAEISSADNVLNVGAGTGYDAAILSKLAQMSTALEYDCGACRAGRGKSACVRRCKCQRRTWRFRAGLRQTCAL